VAAYRILIKASAEKEIDKLPKPDRVRVVGRIAALAKTPRPQGCEKLAAHDDRYRVRQGTYRIVYSISDRELLVWIVKVAHRKDVYR
jgi:mRNA interferase RelE/StbE